MAKKNESILKLLIVAPWWVSVILSATVYIFLKYYLPSIEVESNVAKAFLNGISWFAPMVAFFFLIPVPISLYNSYRKKALLGMQRDIEPIKDFSWKEFEERPNMGKFAGTQFWGCSSFPKCKKIFQIEDPARRSRKLCIQG